MSVQPDLRFYRSCELGKPGCLEAAIEAVHSAGFSVLRPRTRAQEVGRFGEQDLLPLQEKLPVAYAERRLYFNARDEQSDFEAFVQMAWTAPQRHEARQDYVGAVSYQTQLFFGSTADAERYSKLYLMLGKALYRSISPEFGWLDFGDPAGATSDRDVEYLTLPHIYWANFFGPRYVRKLGREWIGNAPGGYVESLNDGGVLYVVSPALGFSGCSHSYLAQVRDYFGVESVG